MAAVASLRDVVRTLEAMKEPLDEEVVVAFSEALDELTALAERVLPVPSRERRRSAAGTSARGDVERSDAQVPADIERSLRITQYSVDGAPIGIFRMDGEGRIVAANEAACQSLGYSADELLKLSIYDVDPNFDRETWLEHRARTRALGGRTFISSHRRKDGSTFPIEVTVKQFEFDGRIYSVSFIKDISDRVKADQERRKLEQRMLQAQKLESLGVLAGGIAHDFNNLLMVILGNIDLAKRDSDRRHNPRPLLEDMSRAATQAADLCRQLLIYAGKGRSVVAPIDLGELLREQAQMLEISVSKSVHLVLELADHLPIIEADACQLRQVFMNLIINASDAIGDAGGRVTLTTGEVECDAEYLECLGLGGDLKPGRYVFVEVADTGPGMTDSVREKIFDPFFSTKTSGRGLGLAAVRGIIQNHRGGIRVYSEVANGTTFKLLFPVPRGLGAEATPEVTPQHWQGSGLVLLVDDERALRKLGTRMLSRLGFEVVTAANGNDALTAFREHGGCFRCVVLDWMMPEMGGGETLRELRRLSPELPVIITSGYPPEDVAKRFADQRLTAFLRKPYSLDELTRAFCSTANPLAE